MLGFLLSALLLHQRFSSVQDNDRGVCEDRSLHPIPRVSDQWARGVAQEFAFLTCQDTEAPGPGTTWRTNVLNDNQTRGLSSNL